MLMITDENFGDFMPDKSGIVDARFAGGENRMCGLIPRDYSRTPYGACDFATPFEDTNVPIIPRDEWPDRIAEHEKNKSNLLHLWQDWGLDSLDQNGIPYCVTEDSEVLTTDGWVPYPNYKSGPVGTMNPTTGQLEFQTPIKNHVYEYKGEMIYSTNRRIDFGVTPDHRMLVRKWDESKRTLSAEYTFQNAGDLGWYFGLPSSTTGHAGADVKVIEIEGDREYDGDDFVQLLSLIVSDGFAGGSVSTKNFVSFCCFDEKKYNHVKALAARCGFLEKPSQRGVWRRADAWSLANWVRKNCYTSGELGSHNKRVPGIIKELSTRQIRLFLDTYGDQLSSLAESGKARLYSSTSKQAIDDLQELMLRVGTRGTICKPEEPVPATLKCGKAITPKHKHWKLYESFGDQLSIDRKKQIERDSYNGNVYCVSVPNGTVITRRNGSVLISGNCHAFSPAGAMLILRKQNGLPYIEISAGSIGGPATGYRNRGAWIGSDLRVIVEKGAATTEYVPMRQVSRRGWKPGAEENAKLHRVTEWWELRRRNLDQHVSCLLQCLPVCVGLNYWGHAVTDLAVRDLNPRLSVNKDSRWGIDFLNSWGRRWGDNGVATRTGSKKYADEAYVPRLTLPSNE